MSDRDSPNPQSGTGEAEASPITSSNHTTTSSTSSSPAGKKSRRDLPPLFWYMELGEWEKATQRAKTHPKEVKARATLRTKSSMIDADGTKISGTKRLALHHACFKLRSTGSAPIPQQTTTENTIPEKREVDPFISVCKFILLLLEMFPEACQVRESRHGCLPLHLAAFASCYIRPPSSDDDEQPPKIPASSSSSAGRGHRRSHSAAAAISRHTGASARKPKPNADSANNKQRLSPVPKPNMISNRSSSESTASSNMTAILMEENFAAAQTYRKQEGYGPVTHPNNNNDNNPPLVPAATMTTTQKIFISNKREQWHCR